ncbi:SH3 domain-binding protein 5-like isoform X2 [Dendronephthya gigantea]|nr:SH3 domain-binding protein 5-like isoform X2 [Dendronephthya gigantea]
MELNEAQQLYRQVFSSASEQLKHKHKKLGKCVDRARPFYLANRDARQAFKQQQEAAGNFERANEKYNSAKGKVADLERIMMNKSRAFDGALQELLNHATVEVMEAAKLKRQSSDSHQQASLTFQAAQKKVKELNKNLKGAILKSRGYFELTAALNRQLDQYKQRIFSVENGLRMAKQEYAAALHALEQISDDIHQRRKQNKLNEALASMPREEGVGAESDDEKKQVETENRYHGDLLLGETVDGLDRDGKSDFLSKRILSDGDEEIDSDNDDATDRINARGERPSVTGSEGNSREDGVFSDIDLS